jgi:hypothetical protein
LEKCPPPNTYLQNKWNYNKMTEKYLGTGSLQEWEASVLVNVTNNAP